MSEPVPNVKGCWYHFTFYQCPVCGHPDTVIERHPPPKPEDPAERYEYRDMGCCGATGCMQFL